MQETHAAVMVLALLLVSMLTCSISIQSVRGANVEDISPLPTVRIEPENVTVKKGAVFSVSIMIENIPADPGMVGVQFIMSWDPTVLHALNMTEVMFHNVTPQSEWGNIWEIRNTINNTAGIPFNWINYPPGYALYACTVYDLLGATDGGYLPISGNHTLATVTLEAMEVGSTTLHLSSLAVGYYTWYDFQPHVLICSSDYHGTAGPLLSSLIMDARVTVSSGLMEDINGDGVVDLFDALFFAQHFGSKQGDTTWDPSMDLNRDGEIDIFDLIIVAHKYGNNV